MGNKLLANHAPGGRVMSTKCLPRDTVQPMEAALRNSNEIICKHRKLGLQVPGKVFRESGWMLLNYHSLFADSTEFFHYFLMQVINISLESWSE